MATQPEGRGRGRGKLILFGEHAVVYGQPAIAAGLDLGAEATVAWAADGPSRTTIRTPAGETFAQTTVGQDTAAAEALEAVLSAFELGGRNVVADVVVEVPIGAGLGSSAAFATATARAIAALTGAGEEAVAEAVDRSERVFHGNPSGIDQHAAMHSGIFFYRRGPHGNETAPVEAPPVRLAVCRAGPSAATSEMVGRVAQRMEREPSLIEHLHLLIGDIARAAAGALAGGDWARIGELMDINHGALAGLGVSTAGLDAACHAARDAGALGAKLTGSGGGGCVVALTPDDAAPVLAAWGDRGWECFEVAIGPPAD